MTGHDPNRGLSATNQGGTSQEGDGLRFHISDLVLKHVIRSNEEKNVGKLRAKWEGPYTMVIKGGKGS